MSTTDFLRTSIQKAPGATSKLAALFGVYKSLGGTDRRTVFAATIAQSGYKVYDYYNTVVVEGVSLKA